MRDVAAPATSAEFMFSELQKWAIAEQPAIVGVIAVREAISEDPNVPTQCSIFVGPNTISAEHLRLLGQMFLFEAERLAERVEETEASRPAAIRLH